MIDSSSTAIGVAGGVRSEPVQMAVTEGESASHVVAGVGDQHSALAGSHVLALNGSRVTARKGSHVTALRGSQIIAKSGSHVLAMPGARVMAQSNSHVTACDESIVIAFAQANVTYFRGCHLDAKKGSLIMPAEGGLHDASRDAEDCMPDPLQDACSSDTSSHD
jgi:hypothetical protein